MINKAVIFLHGDKSDYTGVKKYIDKNTLLIGCDGGTEKILKLGLKPSVVIGDFDSFNPDLINNELKLVRHPEDKDYTDSEAAIKYALSKGAKQTVIVGLLGGRADHLIGNIFLLNKLDFADANIKIIEGKQEIYLISGKVQIKGKKGDIISFIPIFGEVKALSSSGLKYPLENYTLSMQGNSGISNEFMTEHIVVSLQENDKLLVIHTMS